MSPRTGIDSLGLEVIHLFLGLLTHLLARLNLPSQFLIGQLDLSFELLRVDIGKDQRLTCHRFSGSSPHLDLADCSIVLDITLPEDVRSPLHRHFEIRKLLLVRFNALHEIDQSFQVLLPR